MRPTREIKLPRLAVTASVQTDAGAVRETNEDIGLHVSPFSSETRRTRGTLTIVADGMGGHSSGEVASEMAVELISHYYYQESAANNTTAATAAPEALRRAIELASKKIYETAISDEKFFGMGTTVVALVLQNTTAFAAHVGDSRLYRLRGRQMKLLTMDHSQVMEMVKQGIISFEEAQNHDDKNIILRAVGTQPTVEVEISQPFSVEAGDEFLLCSDGLCDMVPEAEILDVWLGTGHDLHETGEKLIELAKAHGGHDNITVGLVRVSPASEVEASKKVRVTRELEALS